MVLVAVPGPHAAAAEFAFAHCTYPSLVEVARDLDYLLACAG
jgi:hypothetical protein